jgi:hypothetical protein
MNDLGNETQQAIVSRAESSAQSEEPQLQELRTRLASLKQRYTRLGTFRRLLIICGILMPVLSSVLILFGNIERHGVRSDFVYLWVASGFGYAVMFFAMAGAVNVRRAELDVKEVEDELDLRQMKSASLEQKAHKLLRIQQGQLSRYLEVILQQSRSIFAVGIGAMLVGVGVVVYTIWQTKNVPGDADPIQKAIVAIVGTIGAILTNYVAAIYLKMFSDIGGAVQKSVSSLSQSTNVNFANVLVAYMSPEKRDEALKEIAVNISKVG